MTDRMTDERLSELLAIQDALGEMLSPGEWKLGRAMKVERKSLNDCARDNTKFRQRIRELEAREEELVTMVETIRNNLHPRISELEESLAEWVADGKAMEGRIRELEAQNKRLTSRGFEDLHDENERLKAKLDRVRGLLDGCDVYVCRPDDGNRLHLITDVLQEAPEQNEALADD